MEECICKKDLEFHGMPIKEVRVHLSWCPKSYVVKDYDKLPWYKKLFQTNPRKWGKIKNY